MGLGPTVPVQVFGGEENSIWRNRQVQALKTLVTGPAGSDVIPRTSPHEAAARNSPPTAHSAALTSSVKGDRTLKR